MISKIPNPLDILSLIGKAASGASDKTDSPADAFQKLFDKVVKGMGATDSAPKSETQTPQQTPAQSQDTEAVDDATAEAMVAAAQQPTQTQTPEAEAEATADAPAGTTVQPMALVTPLPPVQQQTVPAAATETPEQQTTPSGDILAVQVTALPPESPEAQTTTAGQTTQLAQPAQDRFGEMLDQAQQQLDNIANQQTQGAAQNEQAQGADPAIPEGNPQQEQPVDTLPETEQKPPEANQKPAAEAPKQEPSQTQIKEQPAKPLAEQKPLSELPENDRAVMQLKETKQSPKPETPQVTEAASQPEAPRVDNARQPEPQRPLSPQTQPDQMEQVRVEMAKNLEQGRTEFRMQLQPEELGKVDVKMILQGDRLAVEIMASTPKAAEMLQRQADGLLQSLRMQQFEVQTISIVTETEGASGQMGGAFNMMGGQTQNGAQDGTGRFGYTGGGSGSDAQQSDPADAEQQRNPDALLDYAI